MNFIEYMINPRFALFLCINHLIKREESLSQQMKNGWLSKYFINVMKNVRLVLVLKLKTLIAGLHSTQELGVDKWLK